ncbi:hypothetical protein ACFHWT_18625, partial [Micromonospora sp. LOL_021]
QRHRHHSRPSAPSPPDNSLSSHARPAWQRHTANLPAESEQAALKCVYLAVMSLDPTGTGRKRWAIRWKAALNAFEIAFDGRLRTGRK